MIACTSDARFALYGRSSDILISSGTLLLARIDGGISSAARPILEGGVLTDTALRVLTKGGFTSSRKKFKNAFIMTHKRPPRSLPNRLQIMPPIKSSRRTPNVKERMWQQRTGRCSPNNKR